MGELEEPFDPKATMQVDAAEVAEVVEESAGRPASARKTPPPLPSSGPFAAARSAEVAAPGDARQRLRFAVIVAVMLAIAAIGGWMFANLVRAPAPAVSAVTSGPAAPAPMGSAPAASAASPPLTLPPVEIH